MTLKEKFKQWLDTNPREQIREVQLEMIAEEFAMRFGRWMTSGVEFIDDTEQGRIYDYRHKRYTTEQLLEIFKKENNL
jgi:transposase-like protein